MFELTFTVFITSLYLTTAQKCLYHKHEEALECWELSSRTDFSSQHNLKSVRNLEVSSSNITHLTAEILEPLEKLEILVMSGNAIKTVSKEAFWGTESLQYLDLSHNEIDYLDPTIFATNSKIAAIDLSGNQLSFLTVDVFKDLPLLETFNLDGNPIDFCEINTHIALLELRFRNIETNLEIRACSGYYELVPRSLQVQMAELFYYLNVFNVLTLLLLAMLLVTLLALLLQSKQTGGWGWRFPITNWAFLKYGRLKDLPETKLPQAV